MTRMQAFAAMILGSALCGASICPGRAQDHAGVATTQDWPVTGGQPAQDHYSSLSQINRKSVNKLVVAWKYDTGEKGSLESNPIVVGHVLYTVTSVPGVVALDAATGKLLWKFDAGLGGRARIRGVSYWTDGHESRIFAGFRYYLFAIDATTDKSIQSFGENGRVDLRKGLREPYQQQSI
jgi:quinoprotein glucose dehydrogenase